MIDIFLWYTGLIFWVFVILTISTVVYSFCIKPAFLATMDVYKQHRNVKRNGLKRSNVTYTEAWVYAFWRYVERVL